MPQDRIPFGTVVKVKGKEGKFFRKRKGRNKTRVVPFDDPKAKGELVDTTDVFDPEEFEDPQDKAVREAKEKEQAERQAEKEKKSEDVQEEHTDEEKPVLEEQEDKQLQTTAVHN